MTELVGSISLGMSLLAAVLAIVLAIGSWRFDSPPMLAWSRRLMVAFAALLTVAAGMLTLALVQSDFGFSYVARYTERALPLGYKLAAFWAGQEGSILLWTWLIAAAGVIACLAHRKQEGIEGAATVGTIAVVGAFFVSLMLFGGADPFARSVVVPADGQGLNPLLQDPGMIAHPPALFIGYAGFTVPLGLMIGALLARRRDNVWPARMRAWLLVSWAFLTVGILLGAQWAYVELGWGGYWAWDPVENASLLPWLTATALLHSLMAQQHRGMLKVWNAALTASSFLLCILGTFITRSGIIQSVHSFGHSLIGWFFLGFLILAVAFCAWLIISRRRELRTERAIENPVSREGAFLATNILLTIIMATTLVGTIFPLLSGLFMPKGVSVNPNFYNKVVVPMSLLLVAIMALGPILTYGKEGAGRLRRRLLIPLVVSHGAMIALAINGIHNLWALAVAVIVVMAVTVMLLDFILMLVERVRGGEGILAALVRGIDANHRRYAAQIVHLGILMIVAGIAGSSVYNVKQDLKLQPGKSASVAGYELAFGELHEKREANYTAVEAPVVVTAPTGKQFTLRPQRRFYDKSENSASEVAIKQTLAGDFYLILAGWEKGGQTTAFQVILNPLVNWIWIGGLVIIGGALLALVPRLLPWVLRHPQTLPPPLPPHGPRVPADKGSLVPVN